MGQRLMAFTFCVSAIAVTAVSADQPGRPSTSDRVLAYFRAHNGQSSDAFLKQLRPLPPDADAREQVVAGLPKQGALSPSPREGEKIAAAGRVLEYSARSGVITVKVIELDHAFVGLYERTVVLASRTALALVSADEFTALVAHELVHEYVWVEYAAAMQQRDHATMQELELRCDGVAVLMLRHIGLGPEPLVSAVQKMTRYNKWRGVTGSASDYVPLTDRVMFIRAIANLAWSDDGGHLRR